MPIKGRNSVANLQKMTHPNKDLVNEKVCTKFGFNLSISIRSQEIVGKPNCDRENENDRQGESSITHFFKAGLYNYQLR